MAMIISAHNKKVLQEKRTNEKPNQKECNCQKGVKSCPIGGKCQTRAIVYKATIRSDDGDERTYTGCTDRKFKERLYEHRTDANIRDNRHRTKMATHIWNKKDRGIGIQEVKYNIVKKCHKYTAGGDKCDVCLSEKLTIMKDKDSRSINKRTDYMNKCRHKWRQKLAGNRKL